MERMTEPESALQLASALEEWLTTPGPTGSGITQQQTYLYKSLLRLATWTKERCLAGDPWPKLGRNELAEQIMRDTDRSELRKVVVPSQMQAVLQNLRSRLEACPAVQKIGLVPVIQVDNKGGRGLPSTLQIGFEFLSGTPATEEAGHAPHENESPAISSASPASQIPPAAQGSNIEYSQETVQLSCFGKLMFRRNPIRLKSVPGMLIFGWATVAAILATVLWIVTLLGLVLPKNQGSVHYLYTLVTGIGMAWLLWNLGAKPWFDLVDDRIRMADEIWTSMSQRQAQFELIRRDEGRYLQLVHYVSSECPICAAKIHVESGRREFAHRLVGRCSESPREHVFSFDRTTLKGYPLRQRKDGYVL